jgi:glucose/arabinose dehydrogenase
MPRGSPASARPALLLGVVCAALAGAVGATVPAGFTDEVIANNVGGPTAVDFTPDDRMLITTKAGALRVYQGASLAAGAGTLLATPALTFPAANICNDSERGLLGVAVHPNFSDGTPYIYLFYTFQASPPPSRLCVNRVSRFIFPASNVINPATEQILVDNMPSPAGNHNAGDLQFGRDGHLYITIGDGGNGFDARNEHVLSGKVLRITADGGIPGDNPFLGPGTARCNVTGQTSPGNRCQETYLWGFRNPFRMAHDPNAAGIRFFVNDVGSAEWEEIDEGLPGLAGSDFGWPCREGAHQTSFCNTIPGMVDPIFEYQHGAVVCGTTSPTNCNSITGGAFVPNGLWPGFDGQYMFSDFICGEIFRMSSPSAACSGFNWVAADFGTDLGGGTVVHLRFGPFENGAALYYTTFGSDGDVRRIRRNNPAGNDAPVAVASGAPQFGGPPLLVTFNATGSSDPDAGDTLTYFWDFGDGTAIGQTTNLTIQHTYNSPGAFTAKLRARDQNFRFSAPAPVQVQPGATEGLDFFTLAAPCRIADTRNPAGPYGGPALSNGALRVFDIWGVCGVPATARAIAANVTITGPVSGGWLTLFPTGQPEPLASTINFTAGQTRANNAALRLNASGRLTVACHMGAGSVHFILDVVGYFE